MMSTIVRLALRALIRPRLLVLLISTAWHFRRRDWYRRRPFLPLPPADYLRWRLNTAYGHEYIVPTPAELEMYVRWAAKLRKRSGE